jgi:hypothetical protein
MLMLQGIILALSMDILGGLFPAVSAVQLNTQARCAHNEDIRERRDGYYATPLVYVGYGAARSWPSTSPI